MHNTWMHEHWEMIVTGGVVALAVLRYYMKSIFGTYATKEELRKCNEDVRIRINEVERNLSKDINTGVSEIKTILIQHLDTNGNSNDNRR